MANPPEKGNEYLFLTNAQATQLQTMGFSLSDWYPTSGGWWFTGSTLEDFDGVPQDFRPAMMIYMLSTQGGELG